MKTFRDRLTAGFLLMLVVLLNTGCAAEESAGWFELEVAPAKFIPVKFHHAMRTDMTVRVDGENIPLKVPRECNTPETLMEHEGKLYCLALEANRKLGRDDWRYRCFRLEGKEFKEIEAKEFPRSIAIFNIWRPGEELKRYSTGIGGVRIDDVEIGKALDPENGYFVNSYQGRLWYMLEKRNSLGWAEREFGGEEGKKFLKEYIEKYKPVHLTSMEMKRIPKEEAKKLE